MTQSSSQSKTYGDFKKWVQDSFYKQGLMQNLSYKLEKISVGKVEAIMPFDDKLTQQHGYFHGGITGAMVDNVAGYATSILHEEADSVVTDELMIGRVEVIKSSVALSVVKSNIYTKLGDQETDVAIVLCALLVAQRKKFKGRLL